MKKGFVVTTSSGKEWVTEILSRKVNARKCHENDELRWEDKENCFQWFTGQAVELFFLAIHSFPFVLFSIFFPDVKENDWCLWRLRCRENSLLLWLRHVFIWWTSKLMRTSTVLWWRLMLYLIIWFLFMLSEMESKRWMEKAFWEIDWKSTCFSSSTFTFISLFAWYCFVQHSLLLPNHFFLYLYTFSGLSQ